MQTQPRLLSAGTITGDKVRNAAGEDLGKIEELMVDLEWQSRIYSHFGCKPYWN